MKQLEVFNEFDKSLDKVQEAIYQGNEDALKVFCITSIAEKKIKNFNANIKGYVKDEADKYEGKKFEAFGREIERRNGASRPQFKEDDVWSDLKRQLKEREELLKTAIKSSDPIYDNEGVEVPKVTIKYNADSISVK